MLKVRELPALSSKVSPEVRRAFTVLLNILKQGSDAGGLVTAYDLTSAIEGAVGEGATGTKPGRPEGLRADSGFNFIILTVDPPPANWDVSYTEFLRAPVDDFDQAQLVGRVASTMFPDLPPDSSVGATYYYWCRFVNAVGTGPINQLAGTPGTTATDPAYLLDLLTGQVTKSQLYQDLRDEIDDNTAAVQIHAQSIDGLSAQLTFKVDVNGFPAGIGLASEMVNGTPFSQIISIADRHAFVNPAATVLQITAMSRLGSTVTVTTNGVHNLSVDEYVVLTGAEQHEYNGTQKATQIVSSTQFRFTVTGTPASPATVKAGFPGLRCMKAIVPVIIQDGQAIINEAYIKKLTANNFVGQKIVADELSAVLASSYQQIIGWLLQSADGLVTLDMTNKQLKMQTGSRYVEITPGRMVFNNGSINLLEFNNGTLTIRRSDGTALLTSGGGLGLKVVGGANIDDLSVDTLQIANNAVTVPVLAAISGSIDASTEITVAQCSVGIPNIPYAISGQFLVAAGGGTSARLKLYFNTTLLYDTGDILKPRYSEDIGGEVSNWVTYYFDLPMHVNYGYTPSVAGTFYLKAVGSGSCDVSKRSLVAIGSRK